MQAVEHTEIKDQLQAMEEEDGQSSEQAGQQKKRVAWMRKRTGRDSGGGGDGVTAKVGR